MPRDMAQQTGLAWLKSAGVRPTRQRLALATLLIGDGQHRHVTAEGLFDMSRAAGEPVSLATVYNTLKSFSEAGLVHEIPLNGTRSYFDTNASSHAHFYREETGMLEDAPGAEVVLRDLPKAPDGTEIAQVDVVIRLRKA